MVLASYEHDINEVSNPLINYIQIGRHLRNTFILENSGDS